MPAPATSWRRRQLRRWPWCGRSAKPNPCCFPLIASCQASMLLACSADCSYDFVPMPPSSVLAVAQMCCLWHKKLWRTQCQYIICRASGWWRRSTPATSSSASSTTRSSTPPQRYRLAKLCCRLRQRPLQPLLLEVLSGLGILQRMSCPHVVSAVQLPAIRQWALRLQGFDMAPNPSNPAAAGVFGAPAACGGQPAQAADQGGAVPAELGGGHRAVGCQASHQPNNPPHNFTAAARPHEITGSGSTKSMLSYSQCTPCHMKSDRNLTKEGAAGR